MSQPPSSVPQSEVIEHLSFLQRQRAALATSELNKSRKNLLLASTVSVAISITGAIPTKIESLGVEFSYVEQRYFYAFLGLIVIYFTAKFSVEDADYRAKLMDIEYEERQIMYGPNREDIGRRRHLLRRLLTVFIDSKFPILWALLSAIITIIAAFKGSSIFS